MDAILKSLQKLSAKERLWSKEIIAKIVANETRSLDVKKLKGREDVFRARRGDIRIVYRTEKGKAFILAVERRSERTYQF